MANHNGSVRFAGPLVYHAEFARDKLDDDCPDCSWHPSAPAAPPAFTWMVGATCRTLANHLCAHLARHASPPRDSERLALAGLLRLHPSNTASTSNTANGALGLGSALEQVGRGTGPRLGSIPLERMRPGFGLGLGFGLGVRIH